LSIIIELKDRWKKAALIAAIVFITGSTCLHAQIDLSPKHSAKLSTIKSGHKRLVKFYKFYKKDSTRHIKWQEKKYKRLLDSAYHADVKQERVNRRLKKNGVILPVKEFSQMDSLDVQLRHWHAIMKDSTSSDSLKKEAKTQVEGRAIQKAKLYPGFQNLMDQYQIDGDSIEWQMIAKQIPGFDTLSGIFDSNPGRLFAIVEKQSVNKLKESSEAGISSEFVEMDRFRNIPDQYQKQYATYTDKEKLKAQGKEKAVEEAASYFTKHAGKLQLSQAKVSALLSKYNDISNSDDLSHAVKKTSMQGKTFWEHLVIGGNFNIVSTKPVSIDLSPQLGYKFTTRFSLGLGFNYRHTFSDSIKNSWYVSPVNTAFKAFTSYDVLSGFFAYAEWERSGVAQKSNDLSNRYWRNNYFVGVGKKIPIHPKIYLNTMFLYNLNNDNRNSAYPRRFQIRLGFQLSELATRKNRVSYNPNR
jgi:hypothetical protein